MLLNLENVRVSFLRGLLKILSLQDRCFGEFLGVYTKKMG